MEPATTSTSTTATTTTDEEESSLVKIFNDIKEEQQNASEVEFKEGDSAVNRTKVSLESNKSWNDLLPERLDIINGLVSEMKFERPSKIQGFAIANILKNTTKDFVGQAQSGTGKTGAFLVSCMARVDVSVNLPQAICIGPTRELVRQIYDVALKIGKHVHGLRIDLAVPFATTENKKSELDKNHIIIGTPGKIWELINKKLIPIRNVKMLVLDEADEMLDMQSQGDQTNKILNRVRGGSSNMQFCLFSATYNEKVKQFINDISKHRISLLVPVEQLSLEKLRQYYIDCGGAQNKYKVLLELYGYVTVGQTIIFTHTRKQAEELRDNMVNAGFGVSLLTGGQMSFSERDDVMKQFRENKCRVLITTNVLSRGVDVLAVSLVVNYDIPEDRFGKIDYETYLHRIGRSARYGKSGIAINLVHDDRTLQQIKDIENHFSKKIEELPAGNYVKLNEVIEELEVTNKSD